MKNHIAVVSRWMGRIRQAATGAPLARHSRAQIKRPSDGDLSAWDWDTYFNSGNCPGPEPRGRVAPPRAPRLRLLREMNWDAYFNSGSVPSPSPAPQARDFPRRGRPAPSTLREPVGHLTPPARSGRRAQHITPRHRFRFPNCLAWARH
ncbi:hypothetical protein GCM10010315_40530 [Streptomyces luteosporeus]|uniref:Uncharacterized protein n=1 Tax=Streptomyces luteosporeus TaxID=173856 RepID=A0ABP6GBU0_9ACTN